MGDIYTVLFYPKTGRILKIVYFLLIVVCANHRIISETEIIFTATVTIPID